MIRKSNDSSAWATRALPTVGMLGLLFAFAAVPSTGLAASASLSATIINPSPAAFDYFGNSVSAVGVSKVVVGAPSDDAGGVINAGSAYIYSTNGVQLATITNPAPTYNAWFGNSVVGVGTNWVAVGAHRNDSGATDAGAAYVFDVNGKLLTTITNPAPEANDYFGYSLAGVGADKLVVGVPFDDTGLPDVGGAYCFDVNGTLLATITNPVPAMNDYFGNSVAGVGTDKIVVGVYGSDVGAANAGIVHVFDATGVRLGTITNPSPSIEDNFGYCVAGIGTNMIVVGAYKDDTGAIDAGIAYIFDIDGKLLATLANPSPEINDWFGFSVAAVGSDKVVVGAQLDNTGAQDAGIAYVFNTRGVLLATIRNPTPGTNDAFGYSVAGLGSNKVFVGSYQSDVGAQDSGLARIFKINGQLVSDFDGDGITDVGVFRASDNKWYIFQSAAGALPPFQFGTGGDIHIPADYDGDGFCDVAVFRPSTSTWYIFGTATGPWQPVIYGGPGDLPIPADYDGDGKADFAVLRPSIMTWYIHRSSKGPVAPFTYGAVGDMPIPADYDGDGLADIAVFRPSTVTWYIYGSTRRAFTPVQYGTFGDLPVPGDYDGDGFIDYAVFRPSNVTWYMHGTTAGAMTPFVYDRSGDVPLIFPQR
jgi:hypothetical protein